MNNITAFLTLSKKEINRVLRIWIQTLFPPVVSLSLYFIIFGSILGDKIGDIEDFRYIEFIASGLIMMGIITNSYMNVASSLFSNKFGKSIEEILVSPMSINSIILGFCIGGIFRSIIISFLTILISLFFMELKIHNLFVIVFITLITSLLFSLLGFLNGVFAKKFDQISFIPSFVLTPLIYLGGVFYPISILSEPFSSLSKLNPILYMVNTYRYGFIGVSEVSIYFSFLFLSLFTIGIYSVIFFILKKGYVLKE